MNFVDVSFPISDWKDFSNKPIAFFIPDDFWHEIPLLESLNESNIKCLYRLEQMFQGQRIQANIFYIKDGIADNEVQVLKHKSDIYKLLDEYYTIVPIDLINTDENAFIYTTVTLNNYI